MTGSAPMRLYANLTSPYARKVRIVLERLGLTGAVERCEPALFDPAEPLRTDNPLGKMPCLVLADGTAIFDSPVIVEYLAEAYALDLLPSDLAGRTAARVYQALGDGIMDAAIAMGIERLFHDEDKASELWISHQRGKVERGLAQMASRPPEPTTLNLGALTLSCALGYLDWRKPVDWRTMAPGLADWLDSFRAHVPEFDLT